MLRRLVPRATRLWRASSTFQHVPMGPPDPILGLTVAFRGDSSPLKLNLGVGAYRDDNGEPYTLPSVRQAERDLLAQALDHEYAPIDGVPAFRTAALRLAYGAASPLLAAERIAASQTLSGTGALRVAGLFLARFLAGRHIHLPTPSWGNHTPIFRDSGLTVAQYRYYDPATCGLDIDGMLTDIKNAPKGQIFLLHACAHNPTGVDPTDEQWREISRALRDNGHFVLLDMAYQGFASGNPERDATALRTLVDDGHDVMLCQSFAKNFGLYGERAGLWSYVCQDKQEREKIESQMKILVRPLYSNPPIYGARIVSQILNNKGLTEQWRDEVKGMADRINGMRSALRKALEDAGSTRDWSHIEKQIGMFCYSGLTPEQVERLINEYSVYLTKDGRISMAGVTTKNVERLAFCIHEVTK